MTDEKRSKKDLISELKQLRKQNSDLVGSIQTLTENNERLNTLMDLNPSLIFLKDECGRYVYLNKTYEAQFVGTPDWYGKTDFDFWRKESAELFRANDLAVLETGQVIQYLEDSKDLDGTRYCWLNYKFPSLDITEQMRSVEALRLSKERFKKLFHASPVLTSIIDLDTGVFLDVNDTWLRVMEYEREEIIGKSSFYFHSGILTIGTTATENDIILFIKDQGCGVDAELINKLGTPFLTTKEKGTGLGLSICYAIAARHNARIDFETGAEGTTFYIKFPVPVEQGLLF